MISLPPSQIEEIVFSEDFSPLVCVSNGCYVTYSYVRPLNPYELEQQQKAEKFAEYMKEWKQESAKYSVVSKMVSLPSYLKIIGLGDAAIPLILKELAREPDYWFPALRALTGGENPVQPGDQGKLDRLAAAWVNWGRSHGYHV